MICAACQKEDHDMCINNFLTVDHEEWCDCKDVPRLPEKESKD